MTIYITCQILRQKNNTWKLKFIMSPSNFDVKVKTIISYTLVSDREYFWMMTMTSNFSYEKVKNWSTVHTKGIDTKGPIVCNSVCHYLVSNFRMQNCPSFQSVCLTLPLFVTIQASRFILLSKLQIVFDSASFPSR